MSAQAWFNRLWYGRSPPPPWLLPLSWLYGAAAAAHRALYRRGWLAIQHVEAPVIIVGNLTAGGSGKTPLVAWLARGLAAQGLRPGIASRGYRAGVGTARLVLPGDSAAEVGDEPVMLARRTGLPVAIGRARAQAARLLIEAGCNVIVADDGLQHHALARNCEILVVDGERRFGNERLLPAGPLREHPRRLTTVDAVVANGGEAAPGELAMRLVANKAVSLRDGREYPLAEFSGRSVHALAGIGDPERFFRMLRAAGMDVVPHPLDDHAAIGAADIRFDDDNPVLMTEKDAVKCAQEADDRHWFVPVEADFGEADAAALMQVVLRSITRFNSG